MIEKYHSANHHQLSALLKALTNAKIKDCGLDSEIQRLVNEANECTEINGDFKKCISAGNQYPIILNPFGEGIKVEFAEFGLSPEWAKRTVSYPSVNAQLESITGNKTYKKPFKKSQFCLVAMTGYYDDDRLIEFDSMITVPAIYQYNANFEQPIYSFALLTEAKKHDMCLPKVKPENREYFLVSNWKFIRRYFSSLEDSISHLTDIDECSMND